MLRILVITEEDELYLPLSISYLLANCPYEILEVVCARNPLLPGKFQAFKKFYATFGLMPIARHAAQLFRAKMLDKFKFLNRTGRHFSVKRTCQVYDMPYRFVDNVNAPDFLDHCRQLEVELIVAVSPTQIFKEELIGLPKHGCINIHTAKLPEYRGLYPTYWAMAHGEKTLGVTIHYIETGIDTGRTILQDELAIPPRASLNQMLTASKLKGAEMLVKAIGQIAEETVKARQPEGEGSYFSFPTPESYKQFRRHGFVL